MGGGNGESALSGEAEDANPLDLRIVKVEEEDRRDPMERRTGDPGSSRGDPGSPPPLEPLPILRQPFAEAFVWKLLCELRQEEALRRGQEFRGEEIKGQENVSKHDSPSIPLG